MSDINKLYANLKEDGYQLGSESEFISNLKNPEKAKKFYKNMRSDGYNLGEWNDFQGKAGIPFPSRVTEKATDKIPSFVNHEETPLTKEDIYRMGAINAQMQEYEPSIPNNIQITPKSVIGKSVGVNDYAGIVQRNPEALKNIILPPEAQQHLEDNKVITGYKQDNPEVSSTPTPVYGIDANEEKRLREYYASDPQGKKEYDKFLNKLDSYKYQLEDSEKRLKQREAEIRKQYKEEIASAPKDVNNPNPVNDPNELNNRIANELSLQKKELKTAKDIIEAYQQGKYEGTFAQMWGEIKRKAPTVFASTLSLGLSDVKNSLDDYRLTKKFNEKGFENLSIPEQDALTTRAIGSYLQNTIGRKRTYAQDAIGSIVDMAPYMAIYGGSNKIAKGATSAIGLAGKATTMPEKIGVGVLESAIQTLIQPSSINQAIQNINGQTNFDVDNEGKIIYTGQDSGMSFGKAIGKAFVANMVENTSEKGGEVLDIWGNGLRNMLNKKIPQLGRAITSYQNTGVHNLMGAAGFNSLPSEFLEEQFATIGHAVAGDGQGNWKDLIDPRQQLLTATSILAIGSAAGVVSIPQIAARKIQIGKINTAAKKAEQFFDTQFTGENQEINNYIKDKIKNGTLAEQQDVLKTVFEDDFSTENQKKAVYDLFKANLLTQGMRGAEKQMTADNATALEQEGRTVFEKTQQKPNSGTMFAINKKVNEMEAKLGDEFAFMTTDELIDYLDTEDLTPEKTREIEDYLGERSLLSGAIQAMNDKAQEEISQIHAEIDNTTRKDGTRLVVQTTVVNNEHAQTIYITDGNIALDDNGNIVRADSDTTLVGITEQGEPVELTINDISKASYQDAKETKDKIAEDITNRYAQQFSQEAETNPIDVKKQEGAEIQWFENGKPHQGIVIDKAEGVIRIQEGKKIVLKNETELNEQIKNPNTQYHREDIVSLYIDGNQYEGEITADADADGKYSVHVSGYPGKKNFELTADEITAMQTTPVADDNMSDDMSANEGENAITSTGETKQNVREYPKNKKGEIDFDKMDIATTFDYLKETEGEDVALEGLELSLKSVQKKIAANIKAVQDFDTKKYAELKKAETIQEQAKIRAKQKETAERLTAERIELDKQKVEIQGLLPQVQAPVQQPVNKVKEQAVQEQPVIEDETEDSPLQVEAVTEQQPTVTPEPVKHTVDLTGSKAVREKAKSTNVTDNQKRLKALGDYINLDDYILRTIAEGMKFSWKDKAGSKGLGSEFRYEESERKARFNILSADGATPEEFAHAIYELSGSYEIPGLSGMDWMDILNEVHYATRMYTSTKQCLEAAEAMRNVEEMYGVSEEELNNVTEEEINAIPDEISDEEFFEIIGIANFTPEQQEELYNLINEYNEPEQTIRGNEAGSQETDSPQPQERSPQNEEIGKEREITPTYSNGDTVTYNGKQYEINGIGKDEAGNTTYDLEQNGKGMFEDVAESELNQSEQPLENVSVGDRVRFEDDGEELEGVVIEPMPYNKDGEVTVQVTWNNGQHHSKGAQVFNKTQKELENISSGNKLPEQSVKQPWEMTREEIGKLYSQELKKIDEKFGRTININSKTKQDVFKKLQDELDNHKAIIQQALSEGKQVPENVLADYPELKKEEVKPEVKNEIPISEDGLYQIYEYKTKDETFYGVPSPYNKGLRGFGDDLFNTIEHAIKWAERNRFEEVRLEKIRLERIEKKKQEELDRIAELERKEANKGKSKSDIMNEGKYDKILDTKLNYDGVIMTRREFITKLINDGATIKTVQANAIKDKSRTEWNRMDGFQQEAFEKRQKEAGKKTEYEIHQVDGSYYTITKAEYNLAESLLKQSKPIPTPEQPTKQPTLSREPKEVLQERKRLATEEKNRLTKLLSGKAIDMFREQSENELEAGTFDVAQTNNRINELRAIEKELDAQIKLAEQAEKKGTEEAQGQQEVSFEGEKPVEPKSIEDMAQEAVKEQAEPSFSEKYDALLTQNTARTRMEADDLMRANKSIEELKSLLDLKSVKTDMQLPKEILSRIQYLERHPELQEATQKEQLSIIPKTFSVKSFYEFEKQFNNGEIALDAYKKAFEVLTSSKDVVVAELNTMTKEALLKNMNSMELYRYKNEKKDKIVKAIYDDMLMTFTFGSITYDFTTPYDVMIGRKVGMATQNDIDAHVTEVQKQRENRKKQYEEFKKAIENPETLAEFKIFIDKNGIDKLSLEQKAKYDELVTDRTQEIRKQKEETQAQISKVDGVNMSDIIETKHTKTGQPLFVVKLNERVNKDLYSELNSKAKKLGGGYSSYNKDGAIPGFQFKSREEAEKFKGLETESVSAVNEVSQEDKIQNRVSKLRDNANKMIDAADKELNRERLTNTSKRAGEAARMDDRANEQKRIAQTMLNIADAIDNGDVKLLDGISAKTHIDLLDSLIQQAQYAEMNAKYTDYTTRQKHQGEPATIETIEYLRGGYYPNIYASRLKDLVSSSLEKTGVKRIAAQWKSIVSRLDDNGSYQLKSDKEVQDIQDMLDASKDNYFLDHVKDSLANHKRLKAMGIENDSMLRAALREYIQYRGVKGKVDKVKQLERALVGKNVGIDFFPTPKKVVNEMLDYADIQEGMSVLEPSAGNGNIADAIKEQGIKPDVIEISNPLREVLEAKGYDLVGDDFMKFSGTNYDRIIMNPPFGTSADIDHVLHAYSLLKPNGKVVAVMSESTFFRNDAKSVKFREFLDNNGAEIIDVEAGAFNDRTLLNTTGVKTRIVVIDKQEDDNGAMFQSVSPIGFYSTVEKALESINQEKGTKEQFKQMLLKNGAKQAEMDWMGFDELPEKLTKSDIQNWIDENRIGVEEVEKSMGRENDKYTEEELLQFRDDAERWNFLEEKYEEGTLTENQEIELDGFNEKYESIGELYDLITDIESSNNIDKGRGDTKFSQYTLPGGKNYKELLLTMPVKEVDYTKIEKQFGLYELSEELYNKNYDDLSVKELVGLKDEFSKRNPEKVQEYSEQLRKAREKENNKFSSAHFDEPNILAHIRFDERRVGGDTRNPNYGKRVLFIEEFQSDWAQKGKKEGFKNAEYHVTYRSEDGSIGGKTFKNKEEADNFNRSLLPENRSNAGVRLIENGGVPDMPFKKTDQWVNLAARRMMRYAAENGFDRIAWTNGEQQADRYDLSKQINQIDYRHENENSIWVDVFDKDDRRIESVSQRYAHNELESTFGKDVANKIINRENLDEEGGNIGSLTGVDLKVGGEGMKAFYDQIVPSAMSKLGKPFGAKVETIEIPETGMQQSIPVTDLMKETAMAGMPLFQSFSNKYDNAATSEERYNAAVEIAKELDAQNETSTIVAKNNENFISMLPIQYADFVRNNRIGAVLYNGTLIINYVNQINADAIQIAHEHENTHIANNEVHTKADLSKLWDNVPESERRLVSKVYEKMEQSAKGDELIAYAVEDIIKKQGYENYKNGNIDLSLYSQTLQAKLKKTIDYANNKYLANNEGRTKISGSTNKGTNERFQQVNGEGTSTRKRGTANGTDKLPETIEVDGVERSTTNSEGRPIHSTEEGIRNFWRWFGDSKVVDNEGRPLVVNHGSRDEFTIFDKQFSGKSNSLASVGFWFSDVKDFGERFANNSWGGNSDIPVIYNTYLNLRTPYVYESSDYSKELDSIDKEIYELKREKQKLENSIYIWDYNAVEAMNIAKTTGFKDKEIEDYYRNRSDESSKAIDNGFKLRELTDKINNLQSEYYDKLYTDSYQKFKTDVYKIAGMSSKDANIGGLGMAIRNKDKVVEEYVSGLKEKGYDGIIIKNTSFDKNAAGGIENNQYVVFDNTQIKSATGNNGGFDQNNSDIRFQIIGEQGAANLDKAEEKQKQLDIIVSENPMLDDYHTGIRSINDIKTFEEAVEDKDDLITAPDYTDKDVEKALKDGTIIVYSSNSIKNGVFVTPSKMEAQAYSENGKVYSKKVNLNEVAWISNYEGQYANVAQAEEATTRLDNLRVAKEMEATKTEKQDVAIRNSFNYRGTTINQIENIFWNPGQAIGDDFNEDFIYVSNGFVNAVKEGLTPLETISVLDKNKNGEWHHLFTKNEDGSFDTKYVKFSEPKQFTPKEIRQATGWEKGVDGKWRYETTKHSVHPQLQDYIDKSADGFVKWVNARRNNGLPVTLIDIFGKDDETLKALPQLSKIAVRFSTNAEMEGSTGIFNPFDNEIILNTRIANNAEKIFSVLEHEVQHGVQRLEGFAQGANNEMGAQASAAKRLGFESYDAYIKELKKQEDEIAKLQAEYEEAESAPLYNIKKGIRAIKLEGQLNDMRETISKLQLRTEDLQNSYKFYYNAAGEVEARNMQRRMNFTDEEKRNTLLAETAGVSPEDQIIIMEGLGASMSMTEDEVQAKADKIKREGLKSIVPDYIKFLSNVLKDCPKRKDVVKQANELGWDLSKAIEDYMATFATKGTSKAEMERVTKLLGLEDFSKGEVKMILWENANPNDGTTEWKAKRAIAYNNAKDNSIPKFPTSAQIAEYEDSIGNLKLKGMAKAKNFVFRFEESYMNQLASMRKFMEIIEKLGDIPDKYNPYYLSQLRTSAAQTSLERYEKKEYKGLMEAVSNLNKELKKANGLIYLNKDYKSEKGTIDRATLYSLAKAGLGRNERLAREEAAATYKEVYAALEAKYKEGLLEETEYNNKLVKIQEAEAKLANKLNETNDYGGLTGLSDLVGSGAMDFKDVRKVVEDIVAEAEKTVNTKAFWETVKKATSYSLKYQYDRGMMTKQMYEHVLNLEPYYLPLRGYDEETAADLYEYFTSHKGNFNPVLKKAKGHAHLPENPFAHLLSMTASGIMQAENNKVKIALLNLVENNKNDIISIKDTWVRNIGTEEEPEWVEAYPQIPIDATSQEVVKALEDFETQMQALKAEGRATIKSNKLRLTVPIGKGVKSEHAITVKRNGQENTLYVNGNPRLAQAINGMLNPDTQDMSKVLKFTKSINRGMSANFTSRNLEFAITNTMRDIHMAAMLSAIEEGIGYSAKLVKNVAVCQRTLASNLFGSGTKGKYQDYLNEYLENGGQTGFVVLRTIETYNKDVEKLQRSMDKRDALAVPKWIFKQIGDINNMAEQITRFATYVTSREEGRTPVRSAIDAKNITLNFNQKGSGEMGAGWMQSLFLFFNPAMQALYRANQARQKQPARFWTVMGLHGAAGAMIPALAFMMMALIAGDDDDKLEHYQQAYWNTPEWIRRNNLMIWVPGTTHFVKIPLGQELRWAYSIGEIGLTKAMGQEKYGSSTGKQALESVSALLPVDIFGASHWYIPGFATPVYEAKVNENFMGKPIYKETPFNTNDPEWTKAYKNTWGSLTSVSKKLNELSGGDDVSKGKIDINPAITQHLIEGYLGGLVSVYLRGGEQIGKAFSGEEISMNDIPIARRVYSIADKQVYDNSTRREYFDIYNDLKKGVDHKLQKYNKIVNEYDARFNKGEETPTQEDLERWGLYLDKLNKLKQTKDYYKLKEYKAAEKAQKLWEKEGTPFDEANLMKQVVDNVKAIDEAEAAKRVKAEAEAQAEEETTD